MAVAVTRNTISSSSLPVAASGGEVANIIVDPVGILTVVASLVIRSRGC